MIRGLLWLFGAVAGVGLMVGALWMWGRAIDLTAWTARPEVARWGIRSGAVAAAALAQVVLLSFAIRTGRARPFSADWLRILFAGACGVATVSAIALGLAGR